MLCLCYFNASLLFCKEFMQCQHLLLVIKGNFVLEQRWKLQSFHTLLECVAVTVLLQSMRVPYVMFLFKLTRLTVRFPDTLLQWLNSDLTHSLTVRWHSTGKKNLYLSSIYFVVKKSRRQSWKSGGKWGLTLDYLTWLLLHGEWESC